MGNHEEPGRKPVQAPAAGHRQQNIGHLEEKQQYHTAHIGKAMYDFGVHAQ